MMTKTHTIEAILDLNPGANPSFLAEFPSEELTRYLFRLVEVTPMSHENAHEEAGADAPLQRRPA